MRYRKRGWYSAYRPRHSRQAGRREPRGQSCFGSSVAWQIPDYSEEGREGEGGRERWIGSSARVVRAIAMVELSKLGGGPVLDRSLYDFTTPPPRPAPGRYLFLTRHMLA